LFHDHQPVKGRIMRRNLTILVVGSGAREHVLCWSIGKSSSVKRVLCTPGNGGIVPENRRSVKESDTTGIVRLAKEEAVDLVVVGPEAPLVAGLVDTLHEAGIAAFGPNAKAAQLEGSKIYTKTL
jgi:phosphoribosylamine---glycine ligase